MAKPHGASRAARSPGSWLPTCPFRKVGNQIWTASANGLDGLPAALPGSRSSLCPGTSTFRPVRWKRIIEDEGERDGPAVRPRLLCRRRCVAAAGTGWETGNGGDPTLSLDSPCRLSWVASPDPSPEIAPCPPTAATPTLEAEGGGLHRAPAPAQRAWDRVGDAGGDLGLLGAACLLAPRPRGGGAWGGG